MSNPFASLIHSRKFWLAMFDLVISLTLYFVGRYVPGAAEDVKFVIAAIQPVFLLLIGSIAAQNVKGIQAKADEAYNAALMGRLEASGDKPCEPGTVS